MIVRISTGHFEPDQFDAVDKLLREGGARLIPAIKKLAGCVDYYAGIDRDAGKIINVSVWDTREHAQQMAGLAEMLAEAKLMKALGVTFEAMVNYDTVWTIPGPRM